MKTQTQNGVVLAYMKKRRLSGITTLEARDLGILSLSRRICDLSEKGHTIRKEWVKIKSKRWVDVKVKRYILVTENTKARA